MSPRAGWVTTGASRFLAMTALNSLTRITTNELDVPWSWLNDLVTASSTHRFSLASQTNSGEPLSPGVPYDAIGPCAAL